MNKLQNIRILDCEKHKSVPMTKECFLCGLEYQAKLEERKRILELVKRELVIAGLHQHKPISVVRFDEIMKQLQVGDGNE